MVVLIHCRAGPLGRAFIYSAACNHREVFVYALVTSTKAGRNQHASSGSSEMWIGAAQLHVPPKASASP